ncbi:hypothetical protein JCM9140_317 [Halalkalibacter wakoensis JCM 9140]|uniref:Uncharacterized protein n=1 Tax=Halalkalibacter wakoensis JCM 9140 TaxID=1236970 RepID=W4PY51_9BACI|nr:hypothetical protein [Halalkalibacter wakoensis]GAE24398.1 hypothetical protein JCM9140_317 [Halalkalibacter wakoensis JCM 9140]
MKDEEKLLTGAWLDAIGTLISATAEMRALAGLDEINNKLITIGEGLQAVGTLLIGTVTTDDPLNFTGNWIDGAGAATSALAAYIQDVGDENMVDGLRLGILGDVFQSMGASISSLADHLMGEEGYAIGNALQGLGAGLEAIGGVYDLKGREEGQIITTIGAILQALGSNINAVIITRETFQ